MQDMHDFGNVFYYYICCCVKAYKFAYLAKNQGKDAENARTHLIVLYAENNRFGVCNVVSQSIANELAFDEDFNVKFGGFLVKDSSTLLISFVLNEILMIL